jgi:AcrR family transcriptional regulator
MLNEEQEQRAYHHGNVKEALIDEAMKFIEADAIEQLSLRRLAREVGVTPSAVYNHFSDKNALMLAIKLRLYEEINHYFESHCELGPDPEDNLLQICMAYYHYAEEYPARFQLMFTLRLPMEWSTPEFVEVSCRCLAATRKIVLDIYNKYQIPCSEEAVVNTTLLVWSQLHGIIALKNTGSIKAAVAYQDWPAPCALVNDEDVIALIRQHVTMTVNAILNAQHGDNH